MGSCQQGKNVREELLCLEATVNKGADIVTRDFHRGDDRES